MRQSGLFLQGGTISGKVFDEAQTIGEATELIL